MKRFVINDFKRLYKLCLVETVLSPGLKYLAAAYPASDVRYSEKFLIAVSG